MNNRTMLLLAAGAVVIGGVIPGLASPWLAAWVGHERPRGAEGFEVKDVEWTRTERPPEGPYLGTHVSYDGSARIVGTGAAAAGRYIVFFRVIRSRRVDPAASSDTATFWVASSPMGSRIQGQDWTFGCTEQERSLMREGVAMACAKELQEPDARFQVVGWIKLVEPLCEHSDASHTRGK
jgi:hypothetical protein